MENAKKLAACLLQCGPDEMPGCDVQDLFARAKAIVQERFPKKAEAEVRILAARLLAELIRMDMIELSPDGRSVVVTPLLIELAMEGEPC